MKMTQVRRSTEQTNPRLDSRRLERAQEARLSSGVGRLFVSDVLSWAEMTGEDELEIDVGDVTLTIKVTRT